MAAADVISVSNAEISGMAAPLGPEVGGVPAFSGVVCVRISLATELVELKTVVISVNAEVLVSTSLVVLVSEVVVWI